MSKVILRVDVPMLSLNIPDWGVFISMIGLENDNNSAESLLLDIQSSVLDIVLNLSNNSDFEELFQEIPTRIVEYIEAFTGITGTRPDTIYGEAYNILDDYMTDLGVNLLRAVIDNNLKGTWAIVEKEFDSVTLKELF